MIRLGNLHRLITHNCCFLSNALLYELTLWAKRVLYFLLKLLTLRFVTFVDPFQCNCWLINLSNHTLNLIHLLLSQFNQFLHVFVGEVWKLECLFWWQRAAFFALSYRIHQNLLNNSLLVTISMIFHCRRWSNVINFFEDVLADQSFSLSYLLII